MTVSKAAVVSAIRQVLPRARNYWRDPEYTPVDLDKLNRLHKEHLEWLAAMWGIPVRDVRWIENMYDCDKFAGSFDTYANVRFAKKFFLTGIRRPALAVGLLSYLIGGQRGNGHMINVAYTNEGVKFLEPQPTAFAVKNLTEAERNSAWLVQI
jgi:hypothetical protein